MTNRLVGIDYRGIAITGFKVTIRRISRQGRRTDLSGNYPPALVRIEVIVVDQCVEHQKAIFLGAMHCTVIVKSKFMIRRERE
ncbi:MAG TPA: hypothetical protein VGQ55_09340 [Pyrinomonadaceae bacterium]|jgi:hypothetical protein|nr:hypothetical protein [Pyrinomonadaceae bacterium]